MHFELKEKIETIRMNPRRYLLEHIDDFYRLEEMDFSEILVLLMSSIGYGEDTKSYFEAALEALGRLKNGNITEIEKIYYYNIKGVGERFNKNLDLSISNYLESYSIALAVHEIELAARSLLGVATCFHLKGNYDEALRILRQSLSMSVSIQDHSLLGDIFSNYGLNIQYVGNLDAAFEAFETARMHYRKLPNYEDYMNYCVIIGNIALTYIEHNQYEEAEPYMKELLELTQGHDEFFMIAQGAIEVIAQYYTQKKDFENANALYRRLIKTQTSENIQFYAKTKQSDSQVTAQIRIVEKLRQANLSLVSENAMLQEILQKESPHTIELFRTVSEGLANNEFVPFFQEVWNLETNQVAGYEVLVRWEKTPGKFESPASFIDLIENTPLIVKLSEQLIRKSLRIYSQTMKTENEQSRSISFNISPYQLINHNLVRFFQAVCLEYNVPKHLVVIEITERTFIDNNSLAFSQLDELKQAGFRLALDDFGTGYSSLGSIVEMPIDLVKIDRSLIQGIKVGSKSYQLYQGIIFIIKSLGLISIAEGIETEEELEILKKLGCDRVQGYYLHRPSGTLET